MANRHESTSSSKHLSSFDRCQYSFWNKICQTFTNNKKTSSPPSSSSSNSKNLSFDDVKNKNKRIINGNKTISGTKQPCLSIKRIGALASFNNNNNNNHDDDDFSCCPVKIIITGRNMNKLL